jgi:hypothetical protein
MMMALLLPPLTRTAILIHFKINQDYIARALCINRDELINTCNGECYLNKELNKVNENEDEKELPNHKLHDLKITLFCKNLTARLYHEESKPIHHSFYPDHFYISPFLRSIFKPPETHIV